MEPSTYAGALTLMLLSMFCWGSWANTMKLTGRWPFQAFYWDYVAGVAALCFAVGFVFGGPDFGGQLIRVGLRPAVLAVVGGAVFNLANQLLVGAIELAGLAVAFPVGIGLALVVGVALNYVISPAGDPLLLVLGVTIVLSAILVDALAYARREGTHGETNRRGLQISVLAGLLMGIFYPFVAASFHGAGGLNAYTVLPYFALGVVLCAIPVNFTLMRWPLVGAPVTAATYTAAPAVWHLWALLGGAVWACGAAFNFVASAAHLVGPAVSYAIGQGATMVSAAWGVFLWREFKDAPPASRRLIPLMFLLFLAGLTLIALAPVLHLGHTR